MIVLVMFGNAVVAFPVYDYFERAVLPKCWYPDSSLAREFNYTPNPAITFGFATCCDQSLGDEYLEGGLCWYEGTTSHSACRNFLPACVDAESGSPALLRGDRTFTEPRAQIGAGRATDAHSFARRVCHSLLLHALTHPYEIFKQQRFSHSTPLPSPAHTRI